MFFQCPNPTKPDYQYPDPGPPARFLSLAPIAKNLDENFPDPEASIWSPNKPDFDQTGSVSGLF